jgi:hypothetical protein
MKKEGSKKPVSFNVVAPDKEMKVRIKDLNAKSMGLTKDGLKLELREADETIAGSLLITPTNLIWYEGEAYKHGKFINWPEFSKLMKKQRPS